MSKLIDLTGKRFGRWTVRALHPERARYGHSVVTRWICDCDCDVRRVVLGDNLRSGISTSCGCLRREQQIQRLTTHGQSKTRAYRIWRAMLTRCYNPNCPAYCNYGGRGIIVCERWHSFVNFLADMGEPPDGLTLDRIDNNGNYEPTNCHWASRLQQNQNRRPVKRKRRRAKLADIQAFAAAMARTAEAR
jgi:hypothetical protein